MKLIKERIQEQSLLAVPIITDIKGNDGQRHKRADWVEGCEKGIEMMKDFMETLKDFDTWKEWKNTNPIEEVEWDDSHELNNVMNNIVDDVFPEFTLSKSVFDKLSDLSTEHWKQIDWETNEYLKITYETQFIVPLDSGNSLHCHHADYDVNGTIYRLTWTIGGAANEQPIMERKIN